MGMPVPKGHVWKPLADRFWAKVEKTDSCWLWRGFIDKAGYGRIREGGRETPVLYAHRVSLELAGRPVPPGREADHLCNVRHCVNPAHLEAVTASENIQRSYERGRAGAGPMRRTHCSQGHERAKHSYYRKSNGKLVHCRVCRRERRRAAARGVDREGTQQRPS